MDEEQHRSRIHAISTAYRACFGVKEAVKTTKTKTSPAGDVVLKDLAVYCYATRPTLLVNQNGQSDPYAMAFAEGRRDVYNRIMKQLGLETRDLVTDQRRTENA